MVAEDTISCKPLRAETKMMGLITPDDFLEQPGYFALPEEVAHLGNDSGLETWPDDRLPPPQPDSDSVVICILCKKKTRDWTPVTETGI